MTTTKRNELFKQMNQLNWLISFVNDLNYTRGLMQSLVSIRLYLWTRSA